MGRLYISLMHHPVRNKKGETVASAITNLDLHDIARACRTYGAARFFVVSPLADQRKLAAKILQHWREGAGATYNPQRREALSLVEIAADLDEVCRAIRQESGHSPRIIATSSRGAEKTIDFDALRRLMAQERPCLIAFGTAWGFTDAFLGEADHRLKPIQGTGEYNHLSVRSAVSIVLDRLCTA
ncbi:MAG: RNA methyltransferase [Desulfobacterales bacterium]|jgi:hypothetical protein